jgi:tetrahydromethanopterin S-methyltransferase subunit F
VTPSAITITIKMELFSKYRVQFIGRNGRVLSEAISSPAV